MTRLSRWQPCNRAVDLTFGGNQTPMIVFFDIDDTLLDHTAAEAQAAQQWYAHCRHQLPQTGPDFAALWKHGAEQHQAAFLTGAISFTEQRRPRIRAVFPAPLEDQDADRLLSSYLAYYEQSWRAFPDVLPCLDRLTAYTLGILSNGNTQQQRKKLEVLGIAAHPTQCVYVGNQLETDAQAARQAGWIGIWLNRTASEMVLADVIKIPDLGALPPVIAQGGSAQVSLWLLARSSRASRSWVLTPTISTIPPMVPDRCIRSYWVPRCRSWSMCAIWRNCQAEVLPFTLSQSRSKGWGRSQSAPSS